jgi:hypothetical protein
MSNYEKYIHHGNEVMVHSVLKGKHRKYCLCYNCANFKQFSLNPCPIAQEVYNNCVKYKLVTPVWECPNFKEQGVVSE